MASRDGTNRPDGHRRKWDRSEYEKKAKGKKYKPRWEVAAESRYGKKAKKKIENNMGSIFQYIIWVLKYITNQIFLNCKYRFYLRKSLYQS